MQQDTSVVQLNTSLIVPNKYQPRKVFDEKTLKSLADSIKQYGILNPILVRKKDDKYEIIAGERRFRAAQSLGLTEVPVIIKTADEQQMAELALIENLERQELSPIEEAKSYEEIMKIGNQTQASLAEKLGKSQATIANKIRLLSLPTDVQSALAHKKISERHARSLISVSDPTRQLELLNRIIKEKLTVKETEDIISSEKTEPKEDEIKKAISDIMKSLNIKEEEKDDENMNNGNFFPNYDNNTMNNNASLNMMNMQSMNPAPMPQANPEPEMVMPTPLAQGPEVAQTQAPAIELQMPIAAEMPTMAPTMEPVVAPLIDSMPAQPEMPTPIINDAPLFGPAPMTHQVPVTEPQMPSAPEIPVMAPTMEPVVEAPLFNPEAQMAPVIPETSIETPAPSALPQFEIPVLEPMVPDVSSTPVVEDKLTKLHELLNANGYTYKTYSSETDNCIIIEFPKN